MPLAETFLKQYASKYGKEIEGFDRAAGTEMLKYPWPGNIRELQHTIEKAVILCDSKSISTDTLLLRPVQMSQQNADFVTLDDMERLMIAQAMERCNGNMTEVARQLGITRQTLYNKIKRYGL